MAMVTIFDDILMRQKTFRNWPKVQIIDPFKMAEAGLYYTGIKDITRCYFCGNLLHNWEKSDIPKEEHDKYFPECMIQFCDIIKDMVAIGYTMSQILKVYRHFGSRKHIDTDRKLFEKILETNGGEDLSLDCSQLYRSKFQNLDNCLFGVEENNSGDDSSIEIIEEDEYDCFYLV